MSEFVKPNSRNESNTKGPATLRILEDEVAKNILKKIIEIKESQLVDPSSIEKLSGESTAQVWSAAYTVIKNLIGSDQTDRLIKRIPLGIVRLCLITEYGSEEPEAVNLNVLPLVLY